MKKKLKSAVFLLIAKDLLITNNPRIIFGAKLNFYLALFLISCINEIHI